MQEILQEILTEVKNVKIEVEDVKARVTQQDKKIEQKFAEQDKKIEQKFAEQDKKIDQKFAEQDKKIDQKFEEQNKAIERKFEEQNKAIKRTFEEQFNQQNKEIAAELRTIVEYVCKREDKKIEKVEKQLQQEIKNNKMIYDTYNTRIYKLELGQSNIERKVYDLEKLVI